MKEKDDVYIIPIKGGLAEKYGYSNINIKRFIPAENHPYGVNQLIVSAEKWFVLKIPQEDLVNENDLTNKINELIEEHLKNEISKTRRNM